MFKKNKFNLEKLNSVKEYAIFGNSMYIVFNNDTIFNFNRLDIKNEDLLFLEKNVKKVMWNHEVAGRHTPYKHYYKGDIYGGNRFKTFYPLNKITDNTSDIKYNKFKDFYYQSGNEENANKLLEEYFDKQKINCLNEIETEDSLNSDFEIIETIIKDIDKDDLLDLMSKETWHLNSLLRNYKWEYKPTKVVWDNQKYVGIGPYIRTGNPDFIKQINDIIDIKTKFSRLRYNGLKKDMPALTFTNRCFRPIKGNKARCKGLLTINMLTDIQKQELKLSAIEGQKYWKNNDEKMVMQYGNKYIENYFKREQHIKEIVIQKEQIAKCITEDNMDVFFITLDPKVDNDTNIVEGEYPREAVIRRLNDSYKKVEDVNSFEGKHLQSLETYENSMDISTYLFVLDNAKYPGVLNEAMRRTNRMYYIFNYMKDKQVNKFFVDYENFVNKYYIKFNREISKRTNKKLLKNIRINLGKKKTLLAKCRYEVKRDKWIYV